MIRNAKSKTSNIIPKIISSLDDLSNDYTFTAALSQNYRHIERGPNMSFGDAREKLIISYSIKYLNSVDELPLSQLLVYFCVRANSC